MKIEIVDTSFVGSGKNKKKKSICTSCKEVRLVRFDSNALVCAKCSGRKNGAKAIRERTGKIKSCLHCSNEYWEYKYQRSKFCSSNCANTAKRKYQKEIKKCKHCCKEFEANVKPFSNSPGNFCSVVCRNDSYAKNSVKYGFKGHRSRWKAKRNKFIANGNDFCSLCGVKPNRIEVHHVIPYRINKSDDETNLVSLCHKCHSSSEAISYKIAKLDEKNRAIAAAIFMADAQDLWLLHKAKYA